MNVTVSPSEAITLIASEGRSTAVPVDFKKRAPIDSKSSASTNGTHAVGAFDPAGVVGDTEGEAEGDEVGAELGAFDGEALGVFEGAKVGPTEGGILGVTVGELVMQPPLWTCFEMNDSDSPENKKFPPE